MNIPTTEITGIPSAAPLVSAATVKAWIPCPFSAFAFRQTWPASVLEKIGKSLFARSVDRSFTLIALFLQVYHYKVSLSLSRCTSY